MDRLLKFRDDLRGKLKVWKETVEKARNQHKKKQGRINYLIMQYKSNQLEESFRSKQAQHKVSELIGLLCWNLIFVSQTLNYYQLNYYMPASLGFFVFGIVLFYYFPKGIGLLFLLLNVINTLLYRLTICYIEDKLDVDDKRWIHLFFHLLVLNIMNLRSCGFIFNSISITMSLLIIWWFESFQYPWMLAYIWFMLVSCDYILQLKSRRIYYKGQKEKEWREIIHQIIPLKILVSDFDSRTMRLSLYDCSQAAQSYINQKEEDEDKYAKFLENVILNMESSKIKFKMFQDEENLKKYLTHRFIMIDDFLKKNDKKLVKNIPKDNSNYFKKSFTFKSEKSQKRNALFKNRNAPPSELLTGVSLQFAQLDEMEGYYYYDEAHLDSQKRKKIKVKVAYYSVQGSRPLLVISIEDESLREDIEFYKEEKQKSDQFITHMLENYRTTLIKNLKFFNEGWVVVRANFEEIFRNSMVLVNKSYVVYDYLLFLRNRRLFRTQMHRQHLGLMNCEKLNFSNLLKLMVEIFYNIDIVCELENDTEIYSDEKRLKQVFIQLITNCIKLALSAITIRVTQGYSVGIKVIFVNIHFYKEEDNNSEGVLDHLDGTDSPFVNQIELIVLQEIVRCLGPLELKANVAPNGSCEIEFGVYENLKTIKDIMNINGNGEEEEEETSEPERSSLENMAKKRGRSISNAPLFQRKNRKPNRTFFDLKNFHQQDTIKDIPRGSKFVSQEVTNKLQAFLTLGNSMNLSEEDEDEDDKDDDTEKEKDEEEKNGGKSYGSSSKREKLDTVEQEDEEEEASEAMSNRQKQSELLQALSRQCSSVASHSNNNNNNSPALSHQLSIQLSRQFSQMQLEDNISSNPSRLFLETTQLQSVHQQSSSAISSPKFIPKSKLSSFTSFKEQYLFDDTLNHSNNNLCRTTSALRRQHFQEQMSISRMNIGQDSPMKKYLQATTSQFASFDTSKFKDDSKSHSEEFDNDLEMQGCNLTFSIDKTSFEINNFLPRLKN